MPYASTIRLSEQAPTQTKQEIKTPKILSQKSMQRTYRECGIHINMAVEVVWFKVCGGLAKYGLQVPRGPHLLNTVANDN